MSGTWRDHKTIGVGLWLSLYSCPWSGWKLPEDSWGGPCILFFLLKILRFFMSASLKNESLYHILLTWKLEERNSGWTLSASFCEYKDWRESCSLGNCLMNDSQEMSLCLIYWVISFTLGVNFCFLEGRLIICYSFTELMIWYWHSLFRVFAGVALVGLILWLALDTAQRPEQLMSFAGICMFILILFACSKHHSAVSLGYSGWAKGCVLLITKYMCQVLITKT